MTRVFQIVFGQEVLTNTQQREDGSTMRYAKKAPLRDFRFLRGLHGACHTEHLRPPRSVVLATRETRFTLVGGLSLGVVFSSRYS